MRFIKLYQGANFNEKGFSLHLDMAGEIQLKDGNGAVLAKTSHQVTTSCSDWEKIKLRIHRTNRKLSVLQGEETLLTYNLSLSQYAEVSSQPIGWSAYSASSGQYRVAGIKVDNVPFDREEGEGE